MPAPMIDIVGFVAGGLVFLTFCMKSMAALRLIAILSNVAFIAYGFWAELVPILTLHGLLLPMNLFRGWQQVVATRKLRSASVGRPSVLALVPYMTPQITTDGQLLFRKGDPADRLYVISKGTIRFDELGKIIGPGTIFGEIGLFSQDQRRTGTARCIGDGQVCWIDRATITRLHRDHPEFGLMLTRLIATRFAERTNRPVV